MTTYTLTTHPNAHGTERLIQQMSNISPDGSRIVEIVYRLGGDGIVDGSVRIEQDTDGDYLTLGNCYDTLEQAVSAARQALS